MVLRRTGIIAAAIAVTVALAWTAFGSPLFSLDPHRIAVTARGEGVDLAAAQAIVSESAGVPLPRLRTTAMERRLEELTGVRTALVERAWPRGLTVSLDARVPVVAVPADGGVALFDADGVDLGIVETAPPGIPVMDVPLGSDTSRTLTAALAVLASLPEDLRGQVTGVAAPAAEQITLTLGDGAVVHWGDNTENDLKASVLATLRQVPASLYDVSTPRRPVTQ